MSRHPLVAFEKSSAKLGFETIDRLILHAPLPANFDRTIGAYQALESLIRDGHIRAIGVSNFMAHHLTALSTATTVMPVVNQIEVHPYFQQPAAQAANAARGILSQAWSPIGGITVYRGGGTILEDPVLSEIAAARCKSAAQVMLRWHLQQGRPAIPKSVTPSRIVENFDVFDFELTSDELDRIDALETGLRGGPAPEQLDLERYGIPIPEQ